MRKVYALRITHYVSRSSVGPGAPSGPGGGISWELGVVSGVGETGGGEGSSAMLASEVMGWAVVSGGSVVSGVVVGGVICISCGSAVGDMAVIVGIAEASPISVISDDSAG